MAPLGHLSSWPPDCIALAWQYVVEALHCWRGECTSWRAATRHFHLSAPRCLCTSVRRQMDAAQQGRQAAAQQEQQGGQQQQQGPGQGQG